ncbi:hypothetical protein [Labrys neptuniae]
MPVILSSEERSRLAKLAGMLGSNSDGERLNALSFIKRMADAKDVRIDELLLSGQTEVVREIVRWREPPPRQQQPHQQQPDESTTVPSDWEDQLKAALVLDEEIPFLSEWEAGFSSDIISRAGKFVSAKQAAIINRIIDKYSTRKRSRGSAA